METQISETRLADFREQHLTNGLPATRAAVEMLDEAGLSQANAHESVRTINLQLREALCTIGVDEARQAEALKKLLGSKSECFRLDAIREIKSHSRCLPWEKPSVEHEQVQLIVNVKL